jgi:hypothetical protein
MSTTTDLSATDSFASSSDDSSLVNAGSRPPNPPSSRQLRRQAITEETLTGLEGLIRRHQQSLSEIDRGAPHSAISPEALAGEIAGQLAHLRSNLHRYARLG